jgi:hypothetical protein
LKNLRPQILLGNSALQINVQTTAYWWTFVTQN